ncbi:MAG: hypothetical protein HY720_18350 [Planctomycetes bacterium]|nr:hypothetical protein [Planctomycetota bacterium]
MKSRIALIVAVMLGAVATLGVWGVIDKYKKEAQRTLSTKPIAYTRQTLEVGDTLTKDMVEIKHIPDQYVSNDFIQETQIADYIGDKLSARATADSPLMVGYFQLQAKDVSENKPTRGLRAVSIPLEYAAGVSGLLRPGQRVDVIATFKTKIFSLFLDEKGKQRVPTDAEIQGSWNEIKDKLEGMEDMSTGMGGLTKEEFQQFMEEYHSLVLRKTVGADMEDTIYLLQNLIVLATDFRTEEGLTTYESVTLEVSPEQALMLVFALQSGRLHLALRNKNDTDPARLAPVYIEGILDPRRLSGARTVRRGGAPPR